MTISNYYYLSKNLNFNEKILPNKAKNKLYFWKSPGKHDFFLLLFNNIITYYYINYNIKSSNRYQNSLNLFFNDKIMAKCLSQELFH